MQERSKIFWIFEIQGIGTFMTFVKPFKENVSISWKPVKWFTKIYGGNSNLRSTLKVNIETSHYLTFTKL